MYEKRLSLVLMHGVFVAKVVKTFEGKLAVFSCINKSELTNSHIGQNMFIKPSLTSPEMTLLKEEKL